MELFLPLLLTLALYASFCTGFNIDTRFPVIHQENEGSYFGYSVAQHSIDVSSPSYKILVGAPLAQSTSAQLNTYIRTGALFHCDVDVSSSTPGMNCQEFPYPDTAVAPTDLGDGWTENKTDMWLGVSIKSAGPDGAVIGCAHRYNAYNTQQVAGVGMCYRYTAQLAIPKKWEYHSPCFGLPIITASSNSVQNLYGLCQAGTSMDIMDNDLVMGLPGAIQWRGDLKWINSGNKTLKQTEVKVKPVDETYELDSYLGSSTVIGKNLLANNKIIVCAGAPGKNDTGQVVLYTLHTVGDEVAFVKQDDVLNGTQFGESFGQSVQTVDIGKNGNTALIVGAPYYRNKDGVNGAIYFYPNFGEGIVKDQARVRLTVNDCKFDKESLCNNAMFGHAIADLGDINNDGFNDISVGAPYHGNGAVYIYNGLKDGLLSTEPSQVILASEISGAELKGFGISLSGGYNIDSQGYTDIVVGSYQSASVVVLRTRPVVTITGRIELVNPFVDPTSTCDNPTSAVPCIKFEICLKAEMNTNTPSTSLVGVNYNLALDTGYEFPSARRVTFDSTQKESTKSESIELSINQQEECVEYTGFVERLVDYQKPISISLKYSLEENPSPISSDLNQYAIMDENAPKPKQARVDFERDCATPTCDTDLGVRVKFADKAVINQENAGPHAYVFKSDKLTELQVEITLTVSQTAGNNDPAYNPRLYVKLPDALQYKRSTSSSLTASCNVESSYVICDFGKSPIKSGKNETVTVVVDPYNLNDTFVQISVTANTSSKDVVDSNNAANLTIRVVTVTDLEILGSANVGGNIKFGEGPIKGIAAFTTDAEIGDLVEHTYTIFNNGGGRVPKIQVEINWPHQLPSADPNTGKYLLYLLDVPRWALQNVTAGQIINLSSAMVKKLINPQDLAIVDSRVVTVNQDSDSSDTVEYTPTRKKRDALKLGGETQSKGTARLNCNDGSAQCYKFTFEFVNLEKFSEIAIRFRARVWNSTLLEVYGNKYSSVEITSDGRVIIEKEYDIVQTRTDNDFTTVTTFAQPDISLTSAPEVPIWIYIVAAVGGLLLLVIIILVCWKCGFFKRNRPMTHAVTVDKHGEKYQAVDQNETNDT